MQLKSRAGMIAGGYVALAGAYIVFSGQMARAMAGSVEELERLERFKGIAFVIVTGLGLFLVSYLVLRRQQADADEAARARESLLKAERKAMAGLFVSSIAHDANNMTWVIGSTLEMLQKDPGVSPENRENLSDAREAMNTLYRLFKDLKEMGRDRATACVPMELGAMVKRITTLLRVHSALLQCQLVIDAPQPITLPVVPVLIDQVLINLILNAADSTDGRGRIEVRVRASEEAARIEVHDNGKGLPAVIEASLFKPFASTKANGTGLGLVSVRECARAHGGVVEYARSPLGGAAFSVVLPFSPTSTTSNAVA